MEDNEKEVEGTSSRGAEWEVVSLTASAYAAAPSPKEFDQADDTENGKDNERPSPDPLFMSQHFVFPPSEHENLPIEPELNEIHSTSEGRSVTSYMDDANDGFEDTDKNRLPSEYYDGSYGVEFFDEGSSVSIQDVPFKECEGFQSNIEFAEADEHGTSYEVSGENLESPEKYADQNKDKSDGSNLPCEAWWKRHSTSLYRHAREANTFWSVVVAAAVMGLVIIGQRWQKDRWQLHQLNLRFGISEEKLIRMLGPIGRFKDILIGSHQHRPLIQGVGATANR